MDWLAYSDTVYATVCLFILALALASLIIEVEIALAAFL